MCRCCFQKLCLAAPFMLIFFFIFRGKGATALPQYKAALVIVMVPSPYRTLLFLLTSSCCSAQYILGMIDMWCATAFYHYHILRDLRLSFSPASPYLITQKYKQLQLLLFLLCMYLFFTAQCGLWWMIECFVLEELRLCCASVLQRHNLLLTHVKRGTWN